MHEGSEARVYWLLLVASGREEAPSGVPHTSCHFIWRIKKCLTSQLEGVMVNPVHIYFVSSMGGIVSKVAEVLVRALVLCLRHCGATGECRLGWRLWMG